MRYIYRQLREFIRSTHTGSDWWRGSRDGWAPRPSARRTDSMRPPDSSSFALRFLFKSRFPRSRWRLLLVGPLLFATTTCSKPSPEPFIAQLKSIQSRQREKAAGTLLKYGDEVVPRLIEEADFDGMIVLLASDASRAITGSIITIDDAQGFTLY